jgi:hypothetical protein
VNYDIAQYLRGDDIILTLRAWLHRCGTQNVDDWRWSKTTVEGEWFRIRHVRGTSLAQQRAEGLERRHVPVVFQMLPGITSHGALIPESRPGWPDNFANHDEGPSMPGVYTYIDLEKDHYWLGSWSDSLGDGNGCYFVCVTAVNPRATSTDLLEGSKGSGFYQEAVYMSALLIRRMPINAMVGGQTYVCAGVRTGIMPPLLFVQRYELTQAQIDQRAARPPAINAFHPTHRSATDVGRDLAKIIFGELKGAKVSTMLG